MKSIINVYICIIIPLFSVSMPLFAHTNPTCSQLFEIKLTNRETLSLFKDKLDELLNYPIVTPNVTIADLKAMPNGVYRLSGPPTISLIKTLLEWGMDMQEAGLQSYRGQWILILSDKLSVYTPEQLNPVLAAGLLSFDLHTHPKNLMYSFTPSFVDMESLTRTISRVMYIASPHGLSKIVYSSKSESSLLEFQMWAKKKGRDTNSDEYRDYVWKEDFVEYLKEVHSFELIRWTDTSRIQQILSQGSYDPLNDKKFEHNHPKAGTLWHGRPNMEKIGPFEFFPN